MKKFFDIVLLILGFYLLVLGYQSGLHMEIAKLLTLDKKHSKIAKELKKEITILKEENIELRQKIYQLERRFE